MHTLNTTLTKDICLFYLEHYSKVHKKSYRCDVNRINKHLIPIFGHYPLDQIPRLAIVQFHARLSQTAPFEANRVVMLLAAIYTRARKWGLVAGDSPTVAVTMNREPSRERWLQSDELIRLLKAIKTEPNPSARAAFMIWLVTGVRKSELLSAKWEDIKNGIWKLPVTKNGKSHTLPLCDYTQKIFDSIPKSGEWIFPSTDGPRRDFRRQWRRIKKKAKLEDVRLHDLRRTLGSHLASDGVSLRIIGSILNHSSPKVTEVYARIADASRVKALEHFSKKISKIL